MLGKSLVERAGGSSEIVDEVGYESEHHTKASRDGLTTVLVRNT